MNDFGVSILGCTGIVKPRSFGLANKANLKDRSFAIEAGAGCEPTVGTQRKIKGHWLIDNMKDTISSYDFEYVLNKDGKKIERTPEEQMDVQPVLLETEVRETKPTTVRRKK